MICSELKKKSQIVIEIGYRKGCLDLLASLTYIFMTCFDSNEMGGRNIDTDLVVLWLSEKIQI